jgi:hypothetical protein
MKKIKLIIAHILLSLPAVLVLVYRITLRSLDVRGLFFRKDQSI